MPNLETQHLYISEINTLFIVCDDFNVINY